MTTKSAAQTKAPRRLSGTMRNPHARPHGANRRPMVAAALCAVVERTAERIEARLLIRADEELLWDNMARWSILYRCVYGKGREDAALHQRDILAAGRGSALERLQRRMIGFDVAAIEIFAVRGPLTRDQVTEVRAANAELDAERRRLGIYGTGTERAAAVDRWLQKGQV